MVPPSPLCSSEWVSGLPWPPGEAALYGGSGHPHGSCLLCDLGPFLHVSVLRVLMGKMGVIGLTLWLVGGLNRPSKQCLV